MKEEEMGHEKIMCLFFSPNWVYIRSNRYAIGGKKQGIYNMKKLNTFGYLVRSIA